MSTWPEKAKALRDVKNVDELEQKYDDLGEGYDKLVDGLQYNGPFDTARAISKLDPNRMAKILDVGCGTGLIGEELFKEGYRDVQGVDMSAGLLEVAEKKGVYSKLIKARFDPSVPLQCVDGCFDIVASSGCFVQGAHLNQTCLPEIFRLLKPGGYMVITTRKNVFEEEIGGMKLKTSLLDLVNEGVLAKVSHEEKIYSTENNIDLPSIVLSYQLLH